MGNTSKNNWRNTKEYRIWRITAIKEQKRCDICGSLQNREVHHKEDASHHPDLRFDLNNAIVLCSEHHTLFHTKFKKSFRQKTTLEDWNDFKEIVNNIKALSNVKE